MTISNLVLSVLSYMGLCLCAEKLVLVPLLGTTTFLSRYLAATALILLFIRTILSGRRIAIKATRDFLEKPVNQGLLISERPLNNDIFIALGTR